MTAKGVAWALVIEYGKAGAMMLITERRGKLMLRRHAAPTKDEQRRLDSKLAWWAKVHLAALIVPR